MKLLVSEPGRRVIQLRPREHTELRAILAFGSDIPRTKPRLSRDSSDALPADAAEWLDESLAAERREGMRSALRIFEDPLRCVPGTGGYGLHLSDLETEVLLQSLNGVRVAIWESLGCPDEDEGINIPSSDENHTRAFVMELSALYLERLVGCLWGGGPRDEMRR
jgi:hypothetical protein